MTEDDLLARLNFTRLPLVFRVVQSLESKFKSTLLRQLLSPMPLPVVAANTSAAKECPTLCCCFNYTECVTFTLHCEWLTSEGVYTVHLNF